MGELGAVGAKGARTEEVEVQQGLVPRHEHPPVPVLGRLQQRVDHLRGLGHQLLEERGAAETGQSPG